MNFTGIGDIECDDWEIVEEKKILQVWDAKMCHPSWLVYREEDVKEKIKEFVDWTRKSMFQADDKTVGEKAKEIFGERLI